MQASTVHSIQPSPAEPACFCTSMLYQSQPTPYLHRRPHVCLCLRLTMVSVRLSAPLRVCYCLVAACAALVAGRGGWSVHTQGPQLATASSCNAGHQPERPEAHERIAGIDVRLRWGGGGPWWLSLCGCACYPFNDACDPVR